MKCKHVQQQLLDYSEELLEQKTRALIEGHLQHCPECRQELHDLNRTIDLLQSVPFQEPTEQFWHNFTTTVMRRIKHTEPIPARRMFSFFPQARMAFAVAVLIILIGGLIFYFTNSVQQSHKLTAQRSDQQADELPVSLSPAEEKTIKDIFERIADEKLQHDMLETEFALFDGNTVEVFDADNSDEMLYYLISTLTEEEKDLLLSELYKMK
jgi:hypothetical protein